MITMQFVVKIATSKENTGGCLCLQPNIAEKEFLYWRASEASETLSEVHKFELVR